MVSDNTVDSKRLRTQSIQQSTVLYSQNASKRPHSGAFLRQNLWFVKGLSLVFIYSGTHMVNEIDLVIIFIIY